MVVSKQAGDSFSEIAAREHVQAVTRAAGSSFYLGMRILPEDRRVAMFAIYAFCRAVDDIADGNAPDAEKHAALEAWRRRIDALYDPAAATPEDMTARALAPAIRAYGLAREDFHAVIDGMGMDVGAGMRGPTRSRLELYCSRVAGAVGLLSIRVFGDGSPAARDFALALGTALQLTNILRDVAEDAHMGRLYLPAEELDAAGIASRDPAAVLADPRLANVCEAVARTALARYDEARRQLAACDRRALRPAVVMMEMYRRVLERMIAAGWRRIDAAPGLSKLEKIWITLRFGLL
jgi:squalene synthase HpnD